ncbi:tetratricopeptide repeat protein [Parvularcula lutaonensis]|uniref:Tetratricopeptide repeat protein n=1 Tax=Parvularcula lutaonensis TaxID=491923 RepID=A0ABV7M8F9_9PROT|nr:tetratricopeptide repeat protein [Parvularcula lutaonensis]GGY44667.1 hypothetical protein GCM10007148_11970 [Parvularcula lutaonensis]
MASEEDVLLREVDEDLSRDQTFERLRQFQIPLIAGAVAIIGGVAGWQFYESRKEETARLAAEAYVPLSFGAETEPDLASLRTFAEEADSGFAKLAAMRAAQQLGLQGDIEAARDLYASVYEDASVSAPMRDVARIRAAYALFNNRPEEAAEIASQVETEAFRAHAEEITSAAALVRGDYLAARAGFEALAASETAPPGLRARAETYAALADAAANGAAIQPAAPVPDATSFIERFGAELDAAGVGSGTSLGLPQLPDIQPAEQAEETAGENTGAGETGETPQ